MISIEPPLTYAILRRVCLATKVDIWLKINYCGFKSKDA